MSRALVTVGAAVVACSVLGAQSPGRQAPEPSRPPTLKPSGPVFEPLQAELFAAGANLVNAFADIDGDADLDLFVGFDGAPNRLYRNDKGVFTDIASARGVADARATRAAAWGDFDADGDPDLLVGFAPQAPHPTPQAPSPGSVLRLYRNEAGTFADATASAGLSVATGAVRQPVWVDYDGDGDLDLFVGFRDRANMLFRNDGGHFTDIATSVGLADTRKTVGAVWVDFDEDGDLDVAVANMDGDANALYRNDTGRFTVVAKAAGEPPPTRTMAPSASAPPISMATAGSIWCWPTMGRSAFSATGAPAALRIGQRSGAWRSIHATTRAHQRISTTMAGLTST